MKNLRPVLFTILLLVISVYAGQHSSSHWLGTPVHLECESRTNVDCNWKYNEKSINIGNRYRYIFSNGNNTKDCSLVIGLFHEEDVGNWSCWSLSTDKSDGQLLDSYVLTLKLKQHSGYMRSSPHNVTTKIGWAVTIPCKFNIYLEECHWLRNGLPVFIDGRYAFANYRGSGVDCTINITSIQEIDVGSWICATSANNGHGYVVSRVGWISTATETIPQTLLPGPAKANTSLQEHPSNVTVRIGETAKLVCKFKEAVKCIWLRKEQAIHVGYRYSYSDKTNNTKVTDCSLTISNIQMIDQGGWRCVGAADDKYQAVLSNEAFVSLNRDDVTATIVNRPGSLMVSLGENITMNCKFNWSVNCDWLRQGKSVKISDRYSYIAKDKGKNTTDCSINITYVNEVDVGNWSCASMLNYTKSYTEISEGSISLMKVPSKFGIFLNGKQVSESDLVKFQSTDTLVCSSEKSNPAAKLSWRMNYIDFSGKYESQQVGNNLYTASLYFDKQLVPVILFRYGINYLECTAKFANSTTISSSARISFANTISTKTNDDFLAIVTHPKGVVIQEGNRVSVNLTCVFNIPTNCTWEFNNTVLKDQNYIFADGSKGINTSNCSIILNNAQPSTLYGNWLCSGTSFGTARIVKSHHAIISKLTRPSNPALKFNGRIVPGAIYIGNSLTRGNVQCTSTGGNPAPVMFWELIGKNNKTRLADYSTTTMYGPKTALYSVTLHLGFNSANLSDLSSIKCIAQHPSFPGPNKTISSSIIIKDYLAPIDPIMSINGTLVKSAVPLSLESMNDTEIHCVSQNGNPAANMSWELDGQSVTGYVETLTDPSNLYTSILHWIVIPDWSNISKPMELKCVAEHREYTSPHYAQAIVKFVPHLSSSLQIQLQNKDHVLKEGDVFKFNCESNQPFKCAMKLNGFLMENIPASKSVSSHHLIDNHVIEFCIIKIVFSEKYVGKWQCTNVPADDDPNTPTVSNDVWLTLMSSPTGPDILLDNQLTSELMLKYPEEIPDLTCNARGGNPATNLYWILDDNKVNGKEEVIDTGNDKKTTVLHWNLPFNFTKDKNFAVLQCIGQHPGFATLYRLTEVIATMAKIPDDPKILFYQREVFSQPLNISVADVVGIKCVCSNGNPVPKLMWQLNGLSIGGTYERHFVTHGLYTAELRWDQINNHFLVKGPIQLTCIASHPRLHNNRVVRVKAILQNHGKPAENLIQETNKDNSFYYVGISVSTLLLLSIILGLIIYHRLRKTSLLAQDAGCCSGCSIRRMLTSCLDRNRFKRDEPLIQYSQIDKEQEIYEEENFKFEEN